MNADSRYGINAHLPSVEEMQALAQLQASWVRLDFNWYDIEPVREGYDFRLTDSIVYPLVAQGFQLYPTLSYTPEWANGGQGRTSPPANPADWYNFVAHVATHYQGAIRYWGLWNEPNGSGMSVAQYVNLILHPGHDALKAVDPANGVAGPDLATEGTWRRWLTTMLDRGQQYLDYLTVHSYQSNGHAVIDAVDQIRSRGLPIALTETGWNSGDIGEEAQADHVQQLLESLPHSNAIKMFLFDLNSPGFGILGKPAFAVYQSYTVAAV
jgi:hypothetical protein